MNRRLRFIAVALLAGIPSIAAAQSPDTTRVNANDRVAPASAGPRLDATAIAFRVPSVASADTSVTAMLQRRSRDVSKPVAIMIVGAAAIVLGSVVGNDVGDLIVIGGVVAVLYGLYEYLK
jgi:hypothetical protein